MASTTTADTIGTNAAPGDNSLEDLFGGLNPTTIADGVHKITNQIAALEAQNADIAGGRWTLNNAVYQFQQLQPVGQLAVMGALAYVAVKLLKLG